MAESNNRYFDGLRLNDGISLSQARFILSNFCLNHFGPDGQHLADVLDFCVDVQQLQEVLNTIRNEVRSRFSDRLQALAACVREVNETGSAPETSAATTTSRSYAPPAPPPAPRQAAQGMLMDGTSAVPVRASAPRNAVQPQLRPQPQPMRAAEPDPLRLEVGVSLAQARFMLSEFCLEQFGARGQQFMDAMDRCRDVAALQKVLSLIGTDVAERQRECLPKLIDCVREINATV